MCFWYSFITGKMHELANEGYLAKVSSDKINLDNVQVYYITHHAVHSNSKLCVLFNSSTLYNGKWNMLEPKYS